MRTTSPHNRAASFQSLAADWVRACSTSSRTRAGDAVSGAASTTPKEINIPAARNGRAKVIMDIMNTKKEDGAKMLILVHRRNNKKNRLSLYLFETRLLASGRLSPIPR